MSLKGIRTSVSPVLALNPAVARAQADFAPRPNPSLGSRVAELRVDPRLEEGEGNDGHRREKCEPRNAFQQRL